MSLDMSDLFIKRQVPFQLSEIDIPSADDQKLMKLSQKNQLAFNSEEMKAIQDHY